MNFKISNLSRFIEEMRKELNQLGNRKALTHPEVIRLSQKLDPVLNEYQNLQCEAKGA